MTDFDYCPDLDSLVYQLPGNKFPGLQLTSRGTSE